MTRHKFIEWRAPGQRFGVESERVKDHLDHDHNSRGSRFKASTMTIEKLLECFIIWHYWAAHILMSMKCSIVTTHYRSSVVGLADTDNKFKFTFTSPKMTWLRTSSPLFRWSPRRGFGFGDGTRNVIKWWINWKLKRVSRCHINHKFRDIFPCSTTVPTELFGDLAHYHDRARLYLVIAAIGSARSIVWICKSNSFLFRISPEPETDRKKI